MERALGVLALVVLGGLSASEARAGDMPYMWAIGPKIGTIVVPGRYPLSLPSKINNYDFIDDGPRSGDPDFEDPKRDLDANGDPLYTSIERVRDDLQIGADGFYALDEENRIGAGVGFAFGKRYSDMWFTFNFDRVLITEQPFNVVAGVQAGFGNMVFKGEDPDERMRVGHFPVRGRLQGQFMDKTRMYALGIYAGTSIPSSTDYTDLNGNEQPINSPLNFLFYAQAGIELQVSFGDLTPPKNKNDKGGKKGKNNKKGGGGGGGGKGGGGGGGGKKK